ncbi:hypothetical protein AZI86_00295 [Bdellovibrio bacteriovorus]|uniref:DUF2157 domain-containing protein n=1 Tax=Bdellovibrio bacteriovorus TaxID=959 RepID=A0A150WMY0_BDEBC|nr:DUF2157 domain-containing protein [Bdellovibrio bacteriovorus]KYG65555.1 hypothetical protein AZI86_00295 [Bdellovibrio bacteriovorus]
MQSKLTEWQTQGLISQEQVDAIHRYEESLPRINWTQIGFLIMGVGTVALGLVALIGYNWHLIPNAAKLSVGFAILFGLAYLIYSPQGRTSVALQNGLISFFGLYCFAMIGLIAQIYNLSGPGYQTGLFWSAITLLIVTCASHIIVPAFWTLVFTTSLLWGCYEWPPVKENLVTHFNFFLIFLLVITLTSRKFFKDTGLQNCLEYSTLVFWVFGILAASLSFGANYKPGVSFTAIIPHLILSLVALTLVQLSILKKIVKTMFSIIIILMAICSYLDFQVIRMDTVLALLGILGLLAGAIAFYAEGWRKMFNLMMVFIAFKIFEIFVQNSTGLLATGLGLSAAGALVLFGVYAWNKNKVVLESRLQELIK